MLKITPHAQVTPGLTQLPFNISLLQLTAANLSTIKRVSSVNIYDHTNVNFDSEGLYSTDIFGRIGTKERDSNLGYVRLNLPIIHPLLFQNLLKLKSFYKDIVAGKQPAIWNEKEGEFEKCLPGEGDTGYSFFFSKWNKLRFKETGSDIRKVRMDLIDKFRKIGVLDHFLILPAGLRDIEITNGQRKEDDINRLYRKLINISNSLMRVEEGFEVSVFDTARWSMQQTVMEIFDTLMTMLKGKRGWIQQKYGSRKIIHGTRNVITAMNTAVPYLDSPINPTLSHTQVGLIQTLRGALPYTLNGLRTGILGDVFGTGEDHVWLVNPKTYKRELVQITLDTADKYSTRPGLESLINLFFNNKQRNKPIMIDGHYLALVYMDDTSFKVVTDISDVPEDRDPKNLHPMTLTDLMYISTIGKYDKLYGTMTRYPCTGDGSTYPTKYIVRTTTKSKVMIHLDESWNDEFKVYNFPDRSPDAVWLDSLVPHLSRLEKAGADFDGDKFSSPFVYSTEAIEAIEHYFGSKAAYVSADGQFNASAQSKTNKLVIANLTDAPTMKRY